MSSESPKPTRRVFVVGVRGKTICINLDAIEATPGWQRLLADLHADERRSQRAFNARMLRPKQPTLPS